MNSPVDIEPRALAREWRDNPQTVLKSIDRLEELTNAVLTAGDEDSDVLHRLSQFAESFRLAIEVSKANGRQMPIESERVSRLVHSLKLRSVLGLNSGADEHAEQFAIMRESVRFWLEQDRGVKPSATAVEPETKSDSDSESAKLDGPHDSGIRPKSQAELELAFSYLDGKSSGIVTSKKGRVTLSNVENLAFRVLVKRYPGQVSVDSLANAMDGECDSKPPKIIERLKGRLSDVGLTICRAPYVIKQMNPEMSSDDISDSR